MIEEVGTEQGFQHLVEQENEYKMAARLLLRHPDVDSMASVIREDRWAVAIAILDELELVASSMTFAKTVSEPEPLRVALGKLRERYSV